MKIQAEHVGLLVSVSGVGFQFCVQFSGWGVRGGERPSALSRRRHIANMTTTNYPTLTFTHVNKQADVAAPDITSSLARPALPESGRHHYTCYYIIVAGRHIANMTTTNYPTLTFTHVNKQADVAAPDITSSLARPALPDKRSSTLYTLLHCNCWAPYCQHDGDKLSYSYFHACKQTGRCCRTRHHELAGPARPARQAVVNIIHATTLKLLAAILPT
ncbi:hypothetical protein J6590_033374 [Homalodisca vitripennis]|nr:hypothetical protein J6590_033374 [Homalodisca vitripennis]